MNNQRQTFELLPANTQVTDTGEPAGTTLLDYIRLFNRSKWLILATCIGFAAIGYFISIRQPIVYQAKTIVEVNEPNSSFLNIQDLQPTVANMTAESFIQTQLKLLQSTRVLQRAHEKLSAPGKPGDPRGVSTSPDRRVAIDMAADTVRVRSFPNTRIFELQADSTDPKVAADFANMVISEFVEHQLETRLDSTRKLTEWLQGQIQELRRALQGSEAQLQAHANRSGLLFTSDRSSVAEDKLRQLQTELSAAHSQRVNAESRYKIAQTATPESLPDVLGDSSIRSYALKMTELRGQHLDLITTLTPDHYKVKRLQIQIDDLSKTIERERGQILQRIRNEYEAARIREAMLGSAYADQKGVVAGQASDFGQYSLLKREVDTNRQLYESMQQKVKEAGISSAMRVTNVRVLSPAEIPSHPYKPATKTTVLTGLSTGLMLALLAVAVRERLDRRIRQPGQMTFSSVPELGVVLSADLKLPGRGRLNLLELGSGKTPAEPSADSIRSTTPRELLTWTHKPSIQAESYRSVLISLLAHEKEKKTFVVTSAQAQEGKTTTLCNLAIALAEIDRKVLVIDADLREPRLHTIFDIPNNWGLSDVIQERTNLENRSIESFAKPTGITGLYVLPSGPGAASIFRLLCSGRIDELLRSASREFDVILLDTPPMLGIPDARILARKTDGVILIARAGQTLRQTAQDAVQRLLDDGIPVVGTVLNDWKPDTDDYGSYHRYVYGS